MPQIIEFNASSFASLVLLELSETWNDIGLSELPPQESEPLLLFLEQIEAFNQPEFDAQRLILVKAAGGVLQAVYGPAIFRDGDQIVLKLGLNLLPVNQSGDIFSIGLLRGKVSIAEEKDLAGNPYPKATISLVAKSRDIFKLSVQLASKELNFTAAEVEAALINEESLLPFLRQVPGTNALKMQELGLGEFAVKGITKSEGGDHGTSYKLQLADGRAVWTRGNVTTLLESGWQPQPDKPLTLVVTRIEELGEDRFTVDCALRERLPILPPAAPLQTNGHKIKQGEGKTIEVTASKVSSEPTIAQERTLLTVVPSKAETFTDAELDDIPFVQPVSLRTSENNFQDPWEMETNQPGIWLYGTRGLYL